MLFFLEYDDDLRTRIQEDQEYLVNQRQSKTNASSIDQISPSEPTEVRKRHSRKAAAAANAAITTSSSETSASKQSNYKSNEVNFFFLKEFFVIDVLFEKDKIKLFE